MDRLRSVPLDRILIIEEGKGITQVIEARKKQVHTGVSAAEIPRFSRRDVGRTILPAAGLPAGWTR